MGAIRLVCFSVNDQTLLVGILSDDRQTPLEATISYSSDKRQWESTTKIRDKVRDIRDKIRNKIRCKIRDRIRN